MADPKQTIIKLKAHASSLKTVGSVVWREKYSEDCIATILEAAKTIEDQEIIIRDLEIARRE